ncbi:MAG TPA: HAMP domain-containing sensor histidine kinase, partial [Gemmata sp.]|nr:HAMP domain-containing sensor histidine kinase [Gemmata sp.]
MPGKVVGRAAVELPWLCPNTDSLIALADAPASAVRLSETDPALSVFLLRFAQPAAEPDPFGFAAGALQAAVLPSTAAAYLTSAPGCVLPYQSHAYRKVRGVAELAARIASHLAETTKLVPAAAAAAVARLAPLGWYAVLAVDLYAAGDILADLGANQNLESVQSAVWGLDHSAITRRLAARWRLPSWVATTIGCLALPLRVAGPLVSHRYLFAIVQLAVLEAERNREALGLAHTADRCELLDYLRVEDGTLQAHAAVEDEECKQGSDSGLDPNPHSVPLVETVLRLAAEGRRRNGPALVVRLEEQIDNLHRIAAELGDQAGERLRDAKLAGLAELAAGAGHEINNPLAVISGNAQRLLRGEEDSHRREAIEAIVRQANRIAGILRDLMQFARPPRPEHRVFALSELLQGVREKLAGLAEERGVELLIDPLPAGVWLEGDPPQLRDSLRAVLRNAIEAT